ncbi:hypothetical protein, partial [Moraxella osloensis]|uniref:hypothetical protein n=1 Tax=Faucicola osloensis TaxID=34062 RepID=UPI00242B6FCF
PYIHRLKSVVLRQRLIKIHSNNLHKKRQYGMILPTFTPSQISRIFTPSFEPTYARQSTIKSYIHCYQCGYQRQ